VKLLFWTDSGSLVGLLPPWHANGGGKLRLITFPTTDYPNAWSQEAQIEDGKWYHLRIDFTPGAENTEASIFLDGASLGVGALPFDVLGSSSDPQLGVYSFDYGHHDWPVEGLKLWIDDTCLGTPSGTCPSGGAAVIAAEISAARSRPASRKRKQAFLSPAHALVQLKKRLVSKFGATEESREMASSEIAKRREL